MREKEPAGRGTGGEEGESQLMQAELIVITYHIRKRMTPRGGNSFYRDRSERKTETFCGAPVTGYDITWRERGVVWNRSDVERFEPCAACLLKARAK